MNRTTATIEHAPCLILNAIAKQATLGISDAEMARRMHIERSYWTQVRLGKRAGYAILRGLVQGFPGEFDLQVIDFMRHDNNNH